eukprot:scaffold209582_cov16-Tisochrysis_lutea.AAC.1
MRPVQAPPLGHCCLQHREQQQRSCLAVRWGWETRHACLWRSCCWRGVGGAGCGRGEDREHALRNALTVRVVG